MRLLMVVFSVTTSTINGKIGLLASILLCLALLTQDLLRVTSFGRTSWNAHIQLHLAACSHQIVHLVREYVDLGALWWLRRPYLHSNSLRSLSLKLIYRTLFS